LDTETIHDEKWPTVPGAKWVNYTRALEGSAVPIKSKTTARPKRTVARFALDGPVLPLVAETLPLAEQIRRSLLSKSKYLAQRGDPRMADSAIWQLCPALGGKNDQGQPRTGHEHAFFLPADEDGDGRLDHVTVFAPMGFNDLELQAFDKLRRLPFGDGDPLPVLLVGLGTPRDFRAPLLDEATVWVSATPFVVTRYPKTRGTRRDRPEDYASPQAFCRHVLGQELQRRPQLPEVRSIEEVEVMGTQRLRPIQFRRFRNKRGDDGGRRPAGGFRITFATAVAGPVCLGHSCHFGLGLFVPVSAGSATDG
jgi:CRISPR-associated protein Csb2